MLKGVKHSEESKNKISNTLKRKYKFGDLDGKKTEEHKKKISISLTGHKHSEKTKLKIGLGSKGRVVSDERRRKIGDANRGKKYPNRKLSENHCKNISNSHLGLIHTDKTKNLLSNLNKGKILSEETKKKISNSMINYLQNNKTKLKDTKPELAVKDILNKYGIKFKHQKKVSNRLFDFYLPDYNLLIEVDGIFWHSKNIKDEDIKGENLKKIRINDKYKTALAIEKGFKLVRVWQDEIDEFEEIIIKIKNKK